MIDEILINVTRLETRVALMDGGVLQELFVERGNDDGHVGSIYCGKVVRVLPGMQAAFIDIGFERTAFLHINDINLSVLNQPDAVEINTIVREGQLLNVQIMKDPLGSKGARLTTHYSLASHYLVYMPQTHSIGISQRIENDTERARLRALIADLAQEFEVSGGFIVRTAAEGVEQQALHADVALLSKQWQLALNNKVQQKPGALIYNELPMVQRILRDTTQSELKRVLVDDQSVTADLITFAEDFVTEAARCIHYYERQRPIFDAYGIEDEITQSLARRVDLKSGGYVIFDQTEAMTTVDVNTGGFVGKTNLEETAYKTNLEAATTIARQLRVRNLGGMVIIDFIDILDEGYRLQVNRALDNTLAQDRVKTSRYELKELGLVALTRKRTRESLEHILCDSCPACDGQGRIRSVETVMNDLFRDIYRKVEEHNTQQLVVVVAPAVGEALLDKKFECFGDLERDLGLTVRVRIEMQYARDHFDIILL